MAWSYRQITGLGVGLIGLGILVWGAQMSGLSPQLLSQARVPSGQGACYYASVGANQCDESVELVQCNADPYFNEDPFFQRRTRDSMWVGGRACQLDKVKFVTGYGESIVAHAQEGETAYTRCKEDLDKDIKNACPNGVKQFLIQPAIIAYEGWTTYEAREKLGLLNVPEPPEEPGRPAQAIYRGKCGAVVECNAPEAPPVPPKIDPPPQFPPPPVFQVDPCPAKPEILNVPLFGVPSQEQLSLLQGTPCPSPTPTASPLANLSQSACVRFNTFSAFYEGCVQNVSSQECTTSDRFTRNDAFFLGVNKAPGGIPTRTCSRPEGYIYKQSSVVEDETYTGKTAAQTCFEDIAAAASNICQPGEWEYYGSPVVLGERRVVPGMTQAELDQTPGNTWTPREIDNLTGVWSGGGLPISSPKPVQRAACGAVIHCANWGGSSSNPTPTLFVSTPTTTPEPSQICRYQGRWWGRLISNISWFGCVTYQPPTSSTPVPTPPPTPVPSQLTAAPLQSIWCRTASTANFENLYWGATCCREYPYTDVGRGSCPTYPGYYSTGATCMSANDTPMPHQRRTASFGWASSFLRCEEAAKNDAVERAQGELDYIKSQCPSGKTSVSRHVVNYRRRGAVAWLACEAEVECVVTCEFAPTCN